MDSVPNLPALLGDAKGRYRVHVVGNSGTGKSTTGAALASMLGLPYISLDELHWKPNWGEASREEFRAKLRDALDQDDRGWVVDGNYDRRGGLIAFEESTDIIWLDPPFFVYFPRIVLRTFLRLFRLSPPCSPGCDERFSEVFFSKASILWWCWTNHSPCHETNRARMELVGIEQGSDVARRRMRRFGGWGSDVKAWLKDVARMVQSQVQKED